MWYGSSLGGENEQLAAEEEKKICLVIVSVRERRTDRERLHVRRDATDLPLPRGTSVLIQCSRQRNSSTRGRADNSMHFICRLRLFHIWVLFAFGIGTVTAVVSAFTFSAGADEMTPSPIRTSSHCLCGEFNDILS